MSKPESWPPAPSNQQEKIGQLFGHCFEITNLKEGDQIPVGGKSFFSGEANLKVEGDFKKFEDFFRAVDELSGKYDLSKLKEWLVAQGLNIDEKLFSKLLAFTKQFEQKYPYNPESTQNRKKLLIEEGVKLSDIFRENNAECAEIAALAQRYLQLLGVSSSYFSGDVLWNKDWEFSEEHSFIVIRQDDKVYLYDPTNPTNTTQGKFPSIYTTEADFDIEVRKNQKRFVTAKNILSKEEAFYGVNDGTNVDPEKHIV